MTNIDQFESVFKAADKEPFAPAELSLSQVLAICDVDTATTSEWMQQVAHMFARIPAITSASWATIASSELDSLDGMIKSVRDQDPDLICTFRNLRTPETQHPFSLGPYIDVLTQATDIPVLLLPAALPDGRLQIAENLDRVMAITDHLTGDHRLVSYAAYLTQDDGTLYLTHVEDEAVFDKFIGTIGKIPALDTETARESLAEQLLKEPHDYIRSCREILHSARPSLQIEEIVTMGHHLRDYERLIREHQVDLLVLNTKDADQLAMHGIAYALTVELTEIPMLLL